MSKDEMTEIKILDDVFLTEKGVRIFDYVVEIDFDSTTPVFNLTKDGKLILPGYYSLVDLLLDTIWDKNFRQVGISIDKIIYTSDFILICKIVQIFQFDIKHFKNTIVFKDRSNIYIEFKSHCGKHNMLVSKYFKGITPKYYPENLKELISLLNSIRN